MLIKLFLLNFNFKQVLKSTSKTHTHTRTLKIEWKFLELKGGFPRNILIYTQYIYACVYIGGPQDWLMFHYKNLTLKKQNLCKKNLHSLIVKFKLYKLSQNCIFSRDNIALKKNKFKEFLFLVLSIRIH